MKSGIYLIRNTENGKVYVGSSSGIKARIGVHKSHLRNNKHSNIYLQNSWNKYGEASFEFSVLEECKEDMMIIREQAWMDYYDSQNKDKGYNLKDAGNCVKLSEEVKAKMRKPKSKEHREKMAFAKMGKRSNNFGKKGRSYSEEDRKKMSDKLKAYFSKKEDVHKPV